MSNITIEDVQKVAALSGLTLNDEQLHTYAAQFEKIIDYINRLDQVDTNGIEPTYQVIDVTNVMRDDTIIDYGVGKEQLLALAPATEDDQIKVGRVL